MFSRDRGQTEPIAALVAVFALGAGLSLYVGVLGATLPSLTEEAEMSPAAADRFLTEASTAGVIRPPIGGAVEDARPNGYGMNVTLRSGSAVWNGGPPRGDAADCTHRRVSVRVAPGTVRPGSLEVCVWTVR